jgi:diguanylate cyclase (GGDEF)-like protein
MLQIMDMMEYIKDHKSLFYLPILISAPLLYSTQWTHLVYWFSSSNQYVPANSFLRYYPYALFLAYVVLFVGAFAIRYTRHGTAERKGILVSIVVAMVGLFLNIALNIEVDYSALFSSLLLVYYLSLYVLTAKEDTLTQLLNRQCYYKDSVRLKGQITAVVSADMNDLKKINDFEGHDAGDKALVAVAECLTTNGTKSKRVYRIGGDEFAIFYLNRCESEVEDDIKIMRKNLSKTKHECAFGCKMVQNGDVEEAIIAADQEMYTNKAVLKDSNELRIAAHRKATIRVMHEALGSGMWGMEFDEDGNMSSVEWSPEFRKMIGY